MPECERCGTAHSTVNSARWVTESVLLCPDCWEEFKQWVKVGVDIPVGGIGDGD